MGNYDTHLQELSAMYYNTLGVNSFLASKADSLASLGTQVTLKPWIDEPEGSVPFDEQNGIALPLIGAGDTVVLTFVVPIGYDGVIKWLSNNFLGGGFVGFSGDIVWRLFADNKTIRNFSNIQAEKGTPGIPRQISPIRIYSGQTITYTVNHVANVALNGQVVCSLVGYIYPTA